MNDLVTVVIPVYNAQKYLKKCISSVVNQTYTNLDIILVNDCSKDKSGQICDKWAKKDARITVVHKEKNQGLSAARNTGIDTAKGKYIRFLDSDDWLPKNSIEILYNNMIAHSADYCRGDGKEIIRFKRQVFSNKVGFFELNNDFDRGNFYQHVYGICFALYCMNTIKKYNLRFYEGVKMYEDSLFNNLYVKHIKKGVTVNSFVYNYNRLMLSSMSRNNVIDYLFHLKLTMSTYFNIFQNNKDVSKIQGYNNYIHTVLLDLGRRIVEGYDKEIALCNIQNLKIEFNQILKEKNIELYNTSIFLKLFIEGEVKQIYDYLNKVFNNKKNKIKNKLHKIFFPLLRFCVFKLNLIK